MKYKIFASVIIVIFGVLAVLGFVARIHRPDYLNAQKYDKVRVALFPSDCSPLLIGTKEELCRSKYIIVAKATGKRSFVFDNILQELVFEKAIKGNVPLKKGERFFISGCGYCEYDDDDVDPQNDQVKNAKMQYRLSLHFMNFMQKGDFYLIFLEGWQKDYLKKTKVMILNNRATTGKYLDITKDRFAVCKDKKVYTAYQNIADSEFFTNEEKTMKAYRSMKYDLIDRYVKE